MIRSVPSDGPLHVQSTTKQITFIFERKQKDDDPDAGRFAISRGLADLEKKRADLDKRRV